MYFFFFSFLFVIAECLDGKGNNSNNQQNQGTVVVKASRDKKKINQKVSF